MNIEVSSRYKALVANSWSVVASSLKLASDTSLPGEREDKDKVSREST